MVYVQQQATQRSATYSGLLLPCCRTPDTARPTAPGAYLVMLPSSTPVRPRTTTAIENPHTILLVLRRIVTY